MTLNKALEKSKIARLRIDNRLILVTSIEAYESYDFGDWRKINFNDIPQSNDWEAIGYKEGI